MTLTQIEGALMQLEELLNHLSWNVLAIHNDTRSGFESLVEEGKAFFACAAAGVQSASKAEPELWSNDVQPIGPRDALPIGGAPLNSIVRLLGGWEEDGGILLCGIGCREFLFNQRCRYHQAIPFDLWFLAESFMPLCQSKLKSASCCLQTVRQ
jgi:hypothetical protein